MQRVDNHYPIGVQVCAFDIVVFDELRHHISQVELVHFSREFVKYRLVIVQSNHIAIVDVLGNRDCQPIDVAAQDSDVLRPMDWKQGDDRVWIYLIVEGVPARGGSRGQFGSLVFKCGT